MNRVWALSALLVRDLILSLTAAVPLAAALAFGTIAFEYGMDQAQFTTVAGVGTGAICFLAALLLASRANRATTYLVVARLQHRSELLRSLILSSLCITLPLAFMIASGNLLAHRLSLSFPSAFWILPTWLPFLLVTAALGLVLSGLVARKGSHLIGFLLLAGLLVANDQTGTLTDLGFRWLVQAVSAILWPVGTLLARASAGTYDRAYFLAGLLTFGYAALLYLLAVALFKDKDLLWSE